MTDEENYYISVYIQAIEDNIPAILINNEKHSIIGVIVGSNELLQFLGDSTVTTKEYKKPKKYKKESEKVLRIYDDD